MLQKISTCFFQFFYKINGVFVNKRKLLLLLWSDSGSEFKKERERNRVSVGVFCGFKESVLNFYGQIYGQFK